MSEISIPVETINHIFSFVDDRRDLLSPSRASKLFASVAQPHMQYRVIRCTLCTTDLWRQLSQNIALAQNVRSIEIQRQHQYLGQVVNLPPIVPKQFVDHAYDKENRKFYSTLPVKDLPRLRQAETHLIRAIKNMSNLKSFTWHRCAPLLDSTLDEDVEDDIWTALRTSCPDLEHISVTDASENEDDEEYIRPIHHSAIWTLQQDLKSFSYHTYAYRHLGEHVPTDELTKMLLRCSNLEALHLGFTLYSREISDDDEDISSADLNELMANAYWPKLHTLRTGSVHVSPSTAAKFFKTHPTITALSITENTDQARFIKDETFDWESYPVPEPSLTLFPGSLPNLTAITVPNYIFKAIRAIQGPSSRIEAAVWDRGSRRVCWTAPSPLENTRACD